jgi:hypothetical protein
VFAFLLPPWNLAEGIDPRNSLEDRREFWRTWAEKPDCCKDFGVGKKAHKELQQLGFQAWEEIAAFLLALFARCELASTFVECLFAAFKQWLKKSNKPLKISTVAQKHYGHQFMRSHRARVKAPEVLRQQRGMRNACRPVWAQARKAIFSYKPKVSGINVYMGRKMAEAVMEHLEEGGPQWTKAMRAEVFSRIHAEWKGEPKHKKQRYARHARFLRKVQGSFANPVVEFTNEVRSLVDGGGHAPCGAWGAGDEEFPIAIATIKRELFDVAHGQSSVVSQLANRFRVRTGSILQNSSGFPAKVPKLRCCPQKFPCCGDHLTGTAEAGVRDIVELSPHPPTHPHWGDP